MNEDIMLLRHQIHDIDVQGSGKRRYGIRWPNDGARWCVYGIGKRGCPLSVNLVVCACFYNVRRSS